MTKQYQSEIIKNGMNPKCRLCNEYNETIDHIVSGCPVLANQNSCNSMTKLHHICTGK